MGKTIEKQNEGEKRRWIYPRIVRGKLTRNRDLVGGLLLIFLFAAPFVRINGEQAVLLNVLERRFAFFGLVFSPQDFYLFVLAMLIMIVFIALFTVVFGRVWCGWACPQTIFMELIFRRIERWIEGDAPRQRKLAEAPWTFEKVWKRGLKHFLFVLISFITSNVFLAYVIGSGNLITIIKEPVSRHLTGFLAICIFTAVFYFVFARLREIVCTVICPYGRLQGVLLDRKSMIVAYDYQRGEPRGKIRKKLANGLPLQTTGDCIDCDMCVQVCPTGIDIRQGTQLECINCTMCIDACDAIMRKIGRPERLIGFKSEEQIVTGVPFSLGKRFYMYSAVLAVMIVGFGFMLYKKPNVDLNILRAKGTLYQTLGNGDISNLYNAELVNKTNKKVEFHLVPENPAFRIEYIVKDSVLQPGEAAKLTFFLKHNEKALTAYKSKVLIKLMVAGKEANEVSTTFIGPVNF